MLYYTKTTTKMNGKALLLLTTLACTFGTVASAQNDTLHINVGAMLAPSGSISPEEVEKGFEASIGIFGVAQFTKGNTAVTSFYSLTANSLGVAIYQQFTPDFGAYVVGTKSILRNNSYAGLGIGTPLASGRATGFVEYGSSLQTWQPAIYIGAFIPFVRKVH